MNVSNRLEVGTGNQPFGCTNINCLKYGTARAFDDIGRQHFCKFGGAPSEQEELKKVELVIRGVLQILKNLEDIFPFKCILRTLVEWKEDSQGKGRVVLYQY